LLRKQDSTFIPYIISVHQCQLSKPRRYQSMIITKIILNSIFRWTCHHTLKTHLLVQLTHLSLIWALLMYLRDASSRMFIQTTFLTEDTGVKHVFDSSMLVYLVNQPGVKKSRRYISKWIQRPQIEEIRFLSMRLLKENLMKEWRDFTMKSSMLKKVFLIQRDTWAMISYQSEYSISKTWCFELKKDWTDETSEIQVSD